MHFKGHSHGSSAVLSQIVDWLCLDFSDFTSMMTHGCLVDLRVSLHYWDSLVLAGSFKLGLSVLCLVCVYFILMVNLCFSGLIISFVNVFLCQGTLHPHECCKSCAASL